MTLKGRFITSRVGGYVGLVETPSGWRIARVQAADLIAGRFRMTMSRRENLPVGAFKIHPAGEFDGFMRGDRIRFERVNFGDAIERTIAFVPGLDPRLYECEETT